MNRETDSSKLIEIAQNYIGLPYKYGAYRDKDLTSEPEGFDCSFFTYWVFKKTLEIILPLSSLEQASLAFKASKEISDIANAQTGDLIFFRGSQGHYNDDLFPNSEKEIYIGHVGIYIKETEEVIHAQSKQGVVQEKLSDMQTRNPKAYQITFIGNYF